MRKKSKEHRVPVSGDRGNAQHCETTDLEVVTDAKEFIEE